MILPRSSPSVRRRHRRPGQRSACVARRIHWRCNCCAPSAADWRRPRPIASDTSARPPRRMCARNSALALPLVLDGGDCEVGIESTIIDLSSEQPRILRPGTHHPGADRGGDRPGGAGSQSDAVHAPRARWRRTTRRARRCCCCRGRRLRWKREQQRALGKRVAVLAIGALPAGFDGAGLAGEAAGLCARPVRRLAPTRRRRRATAAGRAAAGRRRSGWPCMIACVAPRPAPAWTTIRPDGPGYPAQRVRADATVTRKPGRARHRRDPRRRD